MRDATRLLVVFLMLTTCLGYGQKVDTTLHFPTVEIAAPRTTSFQTGIKKYSFHSDQTKMLQSADLGASLSLFSPIFIKNYGPARLATSTIRGASAAQTAVLWNGFNLNNPMLGQTDFSLLPTFFMDQMSIQYGSNSAAWGSGAIGGTVLLESGATFSEKKNQQLRWNSAIGSFDNLFNGLTFNQSDQKYALSTQAFFQYGQNNFPVENASFNRLPHSQVVKWGAMQKMAFSIKKNQRLNVNLWYQNTDRELPPNLLQTTSESTQQDESLRSSLNWKIVGNQSVIQVRSGFFYEKLNFNDPASRLLSESKTWTTINELEWTKSKGAFSFNVGGNFSFLKAKSTGYQAEQPDQNRVALFAMQQWKSPKNNWQLQFSLRQEWVNGDRVPFIPAFAFEGKLMDQLSWNGTISRSYRIPTFNDLFWQFGGNSELLPEEGWSQEFGLNFREKTWLFSSTFYNRTVNNWIIWLPEGSVWTPQNLQKVWSRGIENQLEWQQQLGVWRVTAQLHYDLTFSTNQRAASATDGSVGKQLIYVPRHKWNTALRLSWKDWEVNYFHQFNGKVFTLSDNSSTLPSYHLDHLYFYKNLKINRLEGDAYFKINNIFGKEYQVVAQFAMPRANWELGWELRF